MFHSFSRRLEGEGRLLYMVLGEVHYDHEMKNSLEEKEKNPKEKNDPNRMEGVVAGLLQNADKRVASEKYSVNNVDIIKKNMPDKTNAHDPEKKAASLRDKDQTVDAVKNALPLGFLTPHAYTKAEAASKPIENTTKKDAAEMAERGTQDEKEETAAKTESIEDQQPKKNKTV